MSTCAARRAGRGCGRGDGEAGGPQFNLIGGGRAQGQQGDAGLCPTWRVSPAWDAVAPQASPAGLGASRGSRPGGRAVGALRTIQHQSWATLRPYSLPPGCPVPQWPGQGLLSAWWEPGGLPARSPLGWRRTQLFPMPHALGCWPLSLALLGVSGQKASEIPKKVNSVCSGDTLTSRLGFLLALALSLVSSFCTRVVPGL